MAHGMSPAMDLMMALMMIVMAWGWLAFGGRRLLAAARRALRGPRAGADVPRSEGGD